MSNIKERIHGTRQGDFVREFFTNSAYFPLCNIFLELLINEPADYVSEPDLYVLLVAATLQAGFISRQTFSGRAIPLLGNLVGPLVYSVFEVLLEGWNFFTSPHHIAYWGFALGIGLSQQLQLWLPRRVGVAFILVENVVRTSIIFVMYAILEYFKDDYASLAEFMRDPPHIFIAVVVPIIGLITGVANVNAERYLRILRETAGQLQEYSQWLLGKELLARAVNDPMSLSLSRHQRAMVFMDIRGFTAWSERHEPEQVVATMNAYYESAEPIWLRHHAIKVKFTADEIMLVFADASSAVEAAREMRSVVTSVLEPLSLSVGTGIHLGPVVEGLMGSRHYKGYDLLGDSVNTAKRLCDNAAGGEILLSQAVEEALSVSILIEGPRALDVKGKHQPVIVYALP